MLKRRERITVKIPLEKIQEGIGISLRKCEEHLSGAEVLIEKDFINDAVALIEFAIEEFGRAVYLRERLQMGSGTIEESLETSHQLKYDKAFSVLPKELKTIWEGFSYFPKEYWGGGYWGEGYWGGRKETISPRTRPNAIFTHFDETTQTWQSGIRADEEILRYIIDTLRGYIKNFKF